MEVYVIAEAGVNHNGDVNIAKKLCLAATEAGANAIKFQTWVTEKIITKNVKQASYQMKNTRNENSQFAMLKPLELSYNEFLLVQLVCHHTFNSSFARTSLE